jgi:Icc-related predicted phosphoesterase
MHEMKISLVSDLHLEFGYQELPGGDVLILAGDIAEARSISKHHHSTKLVANSPNHQFRCSEFFAFECAKYRRVIYVMGNHEHYHGQFHKTLDLLKRLVPDNVTLLEQDYVDIDDVRFLGSTMWTDLNRNCPLTEMHLKSSMNDYRVITMKNPRNDQYHKLIPAHTRDIHIETLNYFRNHLTAEPDRKFVVVSHHAPSHLSIHPRYQHDYLGNGGYVSQLDDFILDHPQIKLWTHGHIHDPIDYLIGTTRVVANPRGYVGREDTSKFNPNLVIEV